MTSPAFNPAESAGPLLTTQAIFAAPVGATVTPRYACWTVPPAISVSATPFEASIGTAKPTPALSFVSPALRIWSLIPITVFVATSISGPPELPWLIAASVWIAPVIEKLFGAVIVRLTALTMPAVMVSWRLNGLPMATTVWPGWADDELPSVSGCSCDAGTSMWMTAVSVDLSLPTTVAYAVEPSWNVTLIDLAPSTTCSAVMMSPFELISKPVPSASAFCDPPGLLNGKPPDDAPALAGNWTVMSTTPGASCL